MRIRTLFLVFCFSFSLVQAQMIDLSFFEFPDRSRFNGRGVSMPDSAWSYQFFTGGHLYGSHLNKHSAYPSASFLGNIQAINAGKPQIFIALGDVVRSIKDTVAVRAWKRVSPDLVCPVYNAPGNHDLDDRARYKDAFGESQKSFYLRDDLFLILDTEFLVSEKGMEKEAVDFVKNEVGKAMKRQKPIRNVFVFSHRILPAVVDSDLSEMDDLANSSFQEQCNQEKCKEILDEIAGIPRKGEFWWFAGDVGASWSVPMMFGESKTSECKVLAVGIGDTDHDALARISVNPEGKVFVVPFPLFVGEMMPVESYTTSYWKERKSKDTEPELGLVDRFLAAVKSKRFWLGFGFAALLGGLFVSIRKRKKPPKL